MIEQTRDCNKLISTGARNIILTNNGYVTNKYGTIKTINYKYDFFSRANDG